jgi:hypothetical protein
MQYRLIFRARYAHIASGVKAMVDVANSRLMLYPQKQ